MWRIHRSRNHVFFLMSESLNVHFHTCAVKNVSYDFVFGAMKIWVFFWALKNHFYLKINTIYIILYYIYVYIYKKVPSPSRHLFIKIWRGWQTFILYTAKQYRLPNSMTRIFQILLCIRLYHVEYYVVYCVEYGS